MTACLIPTHPIIFIIDLYFMCIIIIHMHYFDNMVLLRLIVIHCILMIVITQLFLFSLTHSEEKPKSYAFV